MTVLPALNPPGALSNAPTVTLPAMPSTNADGVGISGTSGQTVQTSPICPDTASLSVSLPNGEIQEANALAMRMLMAFANQLQARGMVEWRVCKLRDGRVGWALFFPLPEWGKVGSEIVPTR